MSPRRRPLQARRRWRALKAARERRLRSATELAGVLVTNGNGAMATDGIDEIKRKLQDDGIKLTIL